MGVSGVCAHSVNWHECKELMWCSLSISPDNAGDDASVVGPSEQVDDKTATPKHSNACFSICFCTRDRHAAVYEDDVFFRDDLVQPLQGNDEVRVV